MRNFLVNLLIVIAIGLCALISLQWHREGRARQTIQKLTDTIHDREEKIQSLEGLLTTTKAEVVRLDKLKNDLIETNKLNKLEIEKLTRDLVVANKEIERHLKQVDIYKEALATANESIQKQNEDIKRQNEDIKRQNEEMKKLAEDRNDVVAKYNKVVADFNELASKWNTLTESLSKTNAPPRK